MSTSRQGDPDPLPAPDPGDPGATGGGPPTPAADSGQQSIARAFQDLTYRDAFWPARAYEDGCDRIALRAFLPPAGRRLIEVGAGFGRLADEYLGYDEVVLLDASTTLVQAARERLAGDARYQVLEGTAFHLPFPDGSFDAVVCIRVLHHFEDPRFAIREFGRVLRPGGVLVLESANKRNLKSIAAYWLRRQRSSPFARGSVRDDGVSFLPRAAGRRARAPRPTPAENAAPEVWAGPSIAFDHAPADLRAWIRSAGLTVEATRTVSIFRLPAISRRVPPALLVGVERRLQSPLAAVTPGPSLFFRAIRGAAPPIAE